MRTLQSLDGRYLCVEQDGDMNFVMYALNPDGTLGPALWDRFSHEASETGGSGPQPPGPSQPSPPADAPSPPPAGGGGFVEPASSTASRPLLDRAAIRLFLPDRGAFQFPEPYGTRGIRVTNRSDGPILPVGYSYWSNINRHAGSDSLLVFVGTGDGHPTFFRVHKRSGNVDALGPLVPYRGTGEGWYWSASRSTSLYLHDGPRLRRYDVVTREDEVVFDITDVHPGCRLWQMHSSVDDQAHCGTVQRITDSGPYEDLGCVAFRKGRRWWLPRHGRYDESALDASGRWVVVKETFERQGRDHLDNRIVDLETGAERVLLDEEGAVGHSDMGAGFMAGEEDQYEPGALVSWRLADPLTPTNRRLEYHLTQWESGLGHVCVRGARALISNAHPSAHPRVNEIVVVELGGSLACRVVAPNLVDFEHGSWTTYDRMPKCNMDPTGTWAAWTANAGTDRLDLFLVEL